MCQFILDAKDRISEVDDIDDNFISLAMPSHVCHHLIILINKIPIS